MPEEKDRPKGGDNTKDDNARANGSGGTIDMKSSEKGLTATEKLYVTEIAKGLGTTARHLIANLLNPGAMPTISYPEETRRIPESFRGRHRLTKRPDGTPKCVACFLCATACPADCIYIEAGEYTDRPYEKYPERYEIDILRCVFCGLCVEACPCDAIRMDTGLYDLCDGDRERLVYGKEFLLEGEAAREDGEDGR